MRTSTQTILTLSIFISTLCFWGSLSANSDSFLQTLEWGFYSNAIPATASGSTLTTTAPLFTQSTLGNTSTTTANGNGGSGGGASAVQSTSNVTTGGSTGAPLLTNTRSNRTQAIPTSAKIPTSSMGSSPNLFGGSSPQPTKSTTRKSRVIRQPESVQTVTIGLNIFAGYSNPQSGEVLTTKNNLKSGTSGVFGEALKADGVVLLTSSAHNYFIKIPVSSGATAWNITNTTTPNWIIDNFMASGNQTIRINYLQKGAKKSSGQWELHIFAITDKYVAQ